MIRLETITDYHEIYHNEEIKEILKESLFNPTEGKVKSLAQSMYSKFKNRFYVAYDGERLVGILGVSKVNHGKCEILHFAVANEERSKGYGKAMIYELWETRGDINELFAETDSMTKLFYERIGFESVEQEEAMFDIVRYRSVLKR